MHAHSHEVCVVQAARSRPVQSGSFQVRWLSLAARSNGFMPGMIQSQRVFPFLCPARVSTRQATERRAGIGAKKVLQGAAWVLDARARGGAGTSASRQVWQTTPGRRPTGEARSSGFHAVGWGVVHSSLRPLNVSQSNATQSIFPVVGNQDDQPH